VCSRLWESLGAWLCLKTGMHCSPRRVKTSGTQPSKCQCLTVCARCLVPIIAEPSSVWIGYRVSLLVVVSFCIVVPTCNCLSVFVALSSCQSMLDANTMLAVVVKRCRVARQGQPLLELLCIPVDLQSHFLPQQAVREETMVG
jgi:hypothetical protein